MATPNPSAETGEGLHLEWALDAACADFLRAHQEFATPEGARGQCSRASALFLDLLLERGVIDPQGQRQGEWHNEEVAVIDGVSHYVARVGRYFIDWTARQYDAAAPFPRITATPPTFDGDPNPDVYGPKER